MLTHNLTQLHGFLDQPLALILGGGNENKDAKMASSVSPSRGRGSASSLVVVKPGGAAARQGGKEKAEAEAALFAGLTAGARDPHAAAKERLAKKVKSHD